LQTRNATVYLSHSWSDIFLDVVSALKEHYYSGDHGVIVWFDIFSLNQRAMSAYKDTFSWYSTVLKSAIRRVGKVLVVVLPWKDPAALHRSWCIYEIYCAVTTECRVEVTLSRDDRNALANDPDTEAIEKLAESVDIVASESALPEDKTNILKSIYKYHGGNDVFHKAVRDRVKQAYERAAY
jgi:hypothetical protein